MGTSDFIPLVIGSTGTETTTIASFLDRLERDNIYIPPYQRDSDQWDNQKKSLFIESIINNFTVPPVIVCPEYSKGYERLELVDGQQRVTTLQSFVKGGEAGGFALCTEDEVDYMDNVRELIQGRRFSELDEGIREAIKYYNLSVVKLPQSIYGQLDIRLEIFRRINESGVPLSPQDLRLGTFSRSDRVAFVRLAGIYDTSRPGSGRMIETAKKQYELDYPWGESYEYDAWQAWWKDSTFATGQNPSEMFLYFLIAKDFTALQRIINSKESQKELKVTFRRTIDSVLDIYAARLQAEDCGDVKVRTLASLQTIREWFEGFKKWFHAIKTSKVADIKPASRVKIAIFIASAIEVWGDPAKVSEKQWEKIGVVLLKGPSAIELAIREESGQGFQYPITRGKWRGQENQILRTADLCAVIAKM